MSLFSLEEYMKRYCSRCNKFHDINYKCISERLTKPKETEARKFRATSRWTRKSLEIRERDKFLCVYCLSKGRITYDNLSVHHIVPLEEDLDNGFDDDNLITLCDEHHKAAEKGDISREELMKLIL